MIISNKETVKKLSLVLLVLLPGCGVYSSSTTSGSDDGQCPKLQNVTTVYSDVHPGMLRPKVLRRHPVDANYFQEVSNNKQRGDGHTLYYSIPGDDTGNVQIQFVEKKRPKLDRVDEVLVITDGGTSINGIIQCDDR